MIKFLSGMIFSGVLFWIFHPAVGIEREYQRAIIGLEENSKRYVHMQRAAQNVINHHKLLNFEIEEKIDELVNKRLETDHYLAQVKTCVIKS